MLEVRALQVAYGETPVVRGVDLTMGADEIVALVGPTGCGKTTFLRAVAGLVPLTAGSVSLGAWTATVDAPVPPERRGLGMVFQDFALFPHLSVEANVAFRVRDVAQVDRWLSILGLDGLRSAKPDRLSGGQKQRVALARALAHEPSLLLLDEPLSSLDAALKQTLREALKSAGVPALWVTHDQAEALSIADRVGVLRGGVLAQLDTPERCHRAPASRFVAEFLGEANYLRGECAAGTAQTPLGSVPVLDADVAGTVDVVLRPASLALAADPNGIGRVEWARFEGETRLYGVRLADDTLLSVRAPQDRRFALAEQVAVTVVDAGPFAAFPADRSA